MNTIFTLNGGFHLLTVLAIGMVLDKTKQGGCHRQHVRHEQDDSIWIW